MPVVTKAVQRSSQIVVARPNISILMCRQSHINASDKYCADLTSMRKHFQSVHFHDEQGNRIKTIHDYNSPAPPAKQPRIVPNSVVITSSMVTPVNDAGLANKQAITINSSTAMINSNSNHRDNSLVRVPVFQLPKGEPLSGQSNMSQLIQEGKIKPILLQNGNEQSILMFVPTANIHDATAPAAMMIPVLPPQTLHQQLPVSQLSSQNTPPPLVPLHTTVTSW